MGQSRKKPRILLFAGILSITSSSLTLATAIVLIRWAYFYDLYVFDTYIPYGVNPLIPVQVTVILAGVGCFAFPFGLSAGVFSIKKIQRSLCLFGASLLLSFGVLSWVNFAVGGMPALGDLNPDFNVHPVQFSIAPLSFFALASPLILFSATSLFFIATRKAEFTHSKELQVSLQALTKESVLSFMEHSTASLYLLSGLCRRLLKNTCAKR